MYMCYFLVCFFFSSRRRHTRCALVTGVQTCALPICIPRRPDRRLAEKPDSPLLCFGVPGKVERRVRMPLGRNQGGGAGRRPAPGDIRPKGIRTRRPLSFGVRCFLVWEKTFLLRGGVPASRVGPAAAIPGKLARFAPKFLTDAAETPRKKLRLDRHGDPWVAVHPVRLLRHGARSEKRRVGQECVST